MTTVQPTVTGIDQFDPTRLRMARERLSQASVWLMRNEPFYSVLLMGLERIPMKGTMGVTYGKLFYDPDFVLDRTEYELHFVLMHEILHIVFGHWKRGKNFPHDIYNQAADYVINNIIVKAGVERARSPKGASVSYNMPSDGLYDPIYDGMITDEVAALLMRKQPPKGGGRPCEEGEGEGPTGNWGEVFKAEGKEGDLTEKELEKLESDLRKQIVQAEQTAKSRGNMSATLRESIDQLREPTTAWADKLRDMMIDTIAKDYTFERPNRMFMESEVIMPTVEKYGLGHVAFFVDDSGSVSNTEMSQFAADCQFIFDELAPERITVIHFDSRGAEPIEVEQGEEFKLERILHGGTDFRAPFRKASECGLDDEIDVAIVLTDGGDYNFPDEPPYPVIWGTTGAFMQGNPPFGDILAVKFQHKGTWS